MTQFVLMLFIIAATNGQKSENCAHCLDKGSIQNLIGYNRATAELCWDICESLPCYPDEVNMKDYEED